MAGVVYQIGSENFTADELTTLGAGDPDLFYRMFFPRTVRQGSAPFHLELDAILEDPRHRYVHARMFRGSAKTTRLRMYTARRVAYGLSHTILYVGASEGHATRSLKWIRNQVERNKVYSGVFALRPGVKWQEAELEIVSDVTGETCWILGVGITGSQLRGINFDDYRPDTIILDDVITDENAATQDQRDKVFDLIDGAIRGSLTPVVEDPNAKLVALQTPLNEDDASARIEKSNQWTTLHCPCWTKPTLDLPVGEQESVWPERYPSEELRNEKRTAAAENRLFRWVREYECRLISREESAFKPEWLKIVDILPAPHTTQNILAIDPVPPPSDVQNARGLVGKDYECLMALGQRGPDYFVHAYELNRGHEPSWTIAKFFELAVRYNITKVVVSAVAYEKTLKWILEQEMRRKLRWFPIELVTDRRPKFIRIKSTLSGVLSHGQLHFHKSQTELIQQVTNYREGMKEHDDAIDALATGMSRLINPVIEQGVENYMKIAMAGKAYKVPRPRGAP